MNLKTNTRPRVNTLPRSGICTNRPLERLPRPFTTKPLNMYLRTTRALASYEGSDDDISTMLSSSTSGTESIATPTAPLLEDEEDRRAIMDLLVELLHDNK